MFSRSAASPLSTAFVKEGHNPMSQLHKVVKPLEVNGMTLDQVFMGASLLLLERGDLPAMELARELLGQSETVEYRTLLRLREQLRSQIKGGPSGANET